MNEIYRWVRKHGFFAMLWHCVIVVWNAIFITPVLKVMLKFSKLKQDRMLFISAPDYSDNGRALSDYMVQAGVNNRREIIWIVSDTKRCRKYKAKNVKFVREKFKNDTIRTLMSQYYAQTAKYVVYTHSMRWIEPVEGQIWVNLWHGCGYKSAKGNSDFINFDHCLVPGEVFRETKAEFFNCDRERFLTMGYPRYDLMLGDKTNGKSYLESLLPGHKKVVMWMPTYRKSIREHLNEDTLVSPFDIPLMYCRKDWMVLDKICKENGILLIVKRHYLQQIYTLDRIKFTNVFFIDDTDLQKNEVQLYEVLAATDALITDYSSVAIDFLLVDRPIAFTLDDFDNYKHSRGFVFENPLEYMPGHHLFEFSDMEAFLQDVSEGRDPHAGTREAVADKVHNRTDNYCKRVVDYFGW